MTLRLCSCAALLPVLLALLPQSAMADGAGKCRLETIAKMPVVMQGPRASVAVSFNGRDSRVWLDSGAFFNFMPKAKAVEMGLTIRSLSAELRISGIGGSFDAQLATVRDFGLLGVTLHNMDFIVGGSDSGNAFLGANLLGVFDTEFDLARGEVNLFKESGCGHMTMAYWSAGMAVGQARLLDGRGASDHHIYVEVIVDGHPLRAVLDSGAETTLVGRHAAERAGIDINAPQVVASSTMSGVGARRRQSWIVRTAMISIGGEQIRNSPIRVIDDGQDDRDHDMLLGMDFLMSHHVMVSLPQRKLFLTYNGGPIFSSTTDREIGHQATRAENMGTSQITADLKTADEFAGRGSGRLDQHDAIGAIADFTDAIKLAPGRADLLAERAGAYLRGGHPELAARDIDAALAITPNDHRLLIQRAQLRLGKGDRAGALADTDAAAVATPRGSLDAMQIVVLYERLGLADRGLALIDPVIDLHRDDSRYAALLSARSWNRALANADLERALKDANTAIRASGPNPAMLATRALVQYRRRDYTAAIGDESSALAKIPKLAASWYIRGLARLANGDAPGGEADIAKAREIQPRIDERYASYGLQAPKAIPASPGVLPAPPPPANDGEKDD